MISSDDEKQTTSSFWKILLQNKSYFVFFFLFIVIVVFLPLFFVIYLQLPIAGLSLLLVGLIFLIFVTFENSISSNWFIKVPLYAFFRKLPLMPDQLFYVRSILPTSYKISNSSNETAKKTDQKRKR